MRGDYGGEIIYDDFWPPRYVSIFIDANAGEQLRMVIHELLHVAVEHGVHGFDETLEEVITVALDAYMFNYIASSKERRHRWEKLIQRKIDEELAEHPNIPLERQVDRRANEA